MTITVFSSSIFDSSSNVLFYFSVARRNPRKALVRESPIGFSGSGIWLISRPGFGILKEKGDEIRDCNYHRDTGFGDFNRRESGNIALKKARFVNSRD